MHPAMITAVLLIGIAAPPNSPSEIVRPFESSADLKPAGTIDQLVFARLQQLGITPANLCSDEVFVRRVYLDVIGTLPTADEAKKFLHDTDPDKRRKLIDRLLQRDEYAVYWALKWGDLLRIKSEFPINLWPNAVQAYHHWIRECLRRNMPYDQFVREMLTASGSNFRVPPVNFYRAAQDRSPEGIARAVALTFMGVRAKNWPAQRFAGMTAMFSQIGYKSTGEWKEEIVCWDPFRSTTDGPQQFPQTVVLPDGTTVQLTAETDPRAVFADWLCRAENPWFARNIVNRIWYWLLGRGIIHEPDDIRPDNPPSNPELLAFLEKELVRSDYDLKHIYRLILNSKTYQLSSIPRSDDPRAAANFAYYQLRRLEAEVLIDAVCQITGTTEEYWSMIPEPYTIIPEGERSIALADGSVTSTFLEMFGRPPRDTGMESERNNRMTAAQRLHLLNSSHIRKKIEQGPGLAWIKQSNRDPLATVDRLYLTILSRHPTRKELAVLRRYGQSGKARGRELAADVVWALINSSEFLYRH